MSGGHPRQRGIPCARGATIKRQKVLAVVLFGVPFPRRPIQSQKRPSADNVPVCFNSVSEHTLNVSVFAEREPAFVGPDDATSDSNERRNESAGD